VTRARALLDAGFYDDDQILSDLMSSKGTAALLRDLDNCPVGDGHRYRDLAAESLTFAMGDIADAAFTRKEAPSCGGRFDVEIPLKTEQIPAASLWSRWCPKYRIRSLIVESKNTAAETDVRDVQQLLSYLVTGRRGRLGILVSRHGFSRGSRKLLSEIALSEEFLFLPLAHGDLKRLTKSRAEPGNRVERLLRQKETALVQAV
jgi:hypothetical protein